MKSQSPSGRSNRRPMFAVRQGLFALSLLAAGCNRTPPTPPIPPADSAATVRPPHQTLMMQIDFQDVGAARASPDTLKKAMQGVATIENGPFVLGGRPSVRFAVSIPPGASAEPVLQKVRTIPNVKNVALVK